MTWSAINDKRSTISEEHFHREPGIDPGIETSGERADDSESFIDQCASHTGRGGFVGSRTVEDDLVMRGVGVEAVGDIVDRDGDGGGDDAWIALARRFGADV